MTGQQFKQRALELNASYKELLSRYRVMGEVLEYYRNEALPLADEQIEAANLGYRLGSLGYIEFIQNTESAIKTRQEYLSRLGEYFEIKEQLEFRKTQKTPKRSGHYDSSLRPLCEIEKTSPGGRRGNSAARPVAFLASTKTRGSTAIPQWQ